MASDPGDAPADAPAHCAHCPLRPLTAYGGLHSGEGERITRLRTRTRQVAPDTEVFAAGTEPAEVATLYSGWAYRHVSFGDGARQILSFVLPGETVALSTLPGEPMSHAVRSLTACTFCLLDKAALRDYLWYDQTACQQVFRHTVQRREDLESQVALLGRRLARPRVAALLTDLHDRLERIGLASQGEFPFPLRHGHVADATGLTPIHVSRVFRDLEGDRLIRRVGRRITILDGARLRGLAGAPDTRADRHARAYPNGSALADRAPTASPRSIRVSAHAPSRRSCNPNPNFYFKYWLTTPGRETSMDYFSRYMQF